MKCNNLVFACQVCQNRIFNEFVHFNSVAEAITIAHGKNKFAK